MSDSDQERQLELRLFLFIAIVLFPVLSVVLMGSYGFIVWMGQLISGPPTY